MNFYTYESASVTAEVNQTNTCNNYRAGNIANVFSEWQKITDDPYILQLVKGSKIDFVKLPFQTYIPNSCKFSASEIKIVKSEIQILLQKGVIKKSLHEKGQFISTIFLRPKKNGKFRMILNLKRLNEFVAYKHFKMDTLSSCTDCILPDTYMASIDLTDAYYSVPVEAEFQKYLKFQSEGVLYQFTCLPNGLASAPRDFTKLLKPVFAYLGSQGHVSCGYLDDIFLTGNTVSQCQANINDTLQLLLRLGFYVSTEKSILTPTKCIEHLGFVLNSHSMTVALTQDKINKLKHWITLVCDSNSIDIRSVAKLVGILVSCFPAVTHGQLFYRQLEFEKSVALKLHRGNFEGKMTVSKKAKNDLQWWKTSAYLDVKSISNRNPDVILQTDASEKGWGAFRKGLEPTGGRWTEEYMYQHINVLELKAAYLGLLSLCKEVTGVHILLQMDNVTAVSYVRNMGGTHSVLLNNIARDIWFWCMERNIWLTATHIAGIKNVVADTASRQFNDNTEWKLNPQVFQDLVTKWGKPDIDMFASHTNFQFKPYVAWKSDPGAKAIDAFKLSWSNSFLYCFPPFSIIAKVLKKVKEEGARTIMVVPVWKAQPWYPMLHQMLCSQPVYLHKGKSLLQLPFDPHKVHPLWPKLRMMACLLSGKDSEVREFQRDAKKS